MAYNALTVGGPASFHKSPTNSEAYKGNFNLWNKSNKTLTADQIAQKRDETAKYRAAQSNEANRQRVAHLTNAYEGQKQGMLGGRDMYRDYMDSSQQYLTDARGEQLGLYDQAMAGTMDNREQTLNSLTPFQQAGAEADSWINQRMNDPNAWRDHLSFEEKSNYLPDRAEEQAMAIANRGGNITGEGQIFANTAYQRMVNELNDRGYKRYRDTMGDQQRASNLGYQAVGAANSARQGYNNSMNSLYMGKGNVVDEYGRSMASSEAQRGQDEFNMENQLGANYANYMNAVGNQGEKYYGQYNAIQNALADKLMGMRREDQVWERQVALQKELADAESNNKLIGSIGGIFGQLAGGPAGGTIAKTLLG